MACRWVWTRAMVDTPGICAAMPADLHALCDAGALFHALRAAPTEDLLWKVGRMKGLYLDLVVGGLLRVDGARRCSMLVCGALADGVTMNNLRYCRKHSGLALLNGLRHTPLVGMTGFCEACVLWNVVGLKTTMNDGGHVHMASERLFVPLHDKASGPLNVRVQRYVKPGFVLSQQWDPYGAFRPVQGTVYYRRGDGSARLVKRGAWYVPDMQRRDGHWAAVWVHLEQQDVRTGQPRTVTRNIEFREIMDQLKSTVGFELSSNVPHETSTRWGGDDDGW